MPVNQASARPVPVFTPEPDSRESSESPESVESVTSPTLSLPPADLKFISPRRPELGVEGRRISLRANHVQVKVKQGYIWQHNVHIMPMCPRHVNRAIISRLVECNSGVWRNSAGAILPVYDGRDNLYTMTPIPSMCDVNGSPKKRLKLQVTLGGPDGRDRTFTVEIQFEKKISLYELLASMEGTRTVPEDAAFALDVALRNRPSMVYNPVGRSFYSPPTDYYNPLGGGREVWFGYHQSVRPSHWNMSLNIDISATAFYRAQSAIDFVKEVLDIRDMDERFHLNDNQRTRLAKEMKGLKVEVTHARTGRKYRVHNITRRSVQMQCFPLQLETGQTVECSVAKFFQDKYDIKLKYTGLPCIQAGQENKHSYLPLEVCNIVEGQRCFKKLTDMQTSTMIKATARSAPDREREINNLIRKADFNNDPYVKEFGLDVSKNMIETPGRILRPPQLQFGGRNYRSTTTPSQGVWDLRDKQFYQGATIRDWAIACFTPQQSVRPQDLKIFVDKLINISDSLGMRIVREPSFCKYIQEQSNVQPMFTYLMKEFPQLQLILVVLPGKTPVYAEVKRIGDSMYGLATQCIRSKNINKTTAQMLSNLCLKINAKLGGINTILVPEHRPKLFQEPVIFMGATVAHPHAAEVRDNKNKASIAALVSSIDAHPAIYSAVVRMQQARRDVITSMSSMVKDSLVNFYRKTGFKPHRIVLYRDAVSEHQFQNVLHHELVAIRQACMDLEQDYRPGITFIVVQKRHHTRLFCAEKKDAHGRTGNIPAGTTVDANITHPTEHDFYLCSHQGVQGTSRPTYYRILWDDNKLGADELQQLSYQLCYTYTRCTRSVSIPAPVYYSHLVAIRARYHIMDKDNDGDAFDSNYESSNVGVEKAIEVHEASKNVMYFA